MPELKVSFRPELRRPVLLAAFRGWNDGGQGASLGGGYLAKQWSAERFAEIDAGCREEARVQLPVHA